MFVRPAKKVAKAAVITMLAATILVGNSISAVQAQNGAEATTTERLLACDGIADSAAKLACYDAVVDSIGQSDTVPEVDVQPTPAPEPVTERIQEAAEELPQQLPEEPAQESVQIPEASPTPIPAADAVPPAAPVEKAAGKVEEVPSVSPDVDVAPSAPVSAADEFGRDTMRGEKPKEEKKPKQVISIEAVIVSARRTPDDRFTVQLDNGQIWRETEGTRVGMPKVDRSVKITEGRFGGYRMRIDGIRKTAWVRRTK